MAPTGEPNESSEFAYRDATTEDRDEVLAFTASTWEHGDYIADVYDEWLGDTSGRFLVAVEAASGRIAAIDKLSFIRPGEAWFEGLRVNPDFRGRGLASHTQRHMIEVARGQGARTIRLLTRADNHPVHAMAYRDGFRLLMLTRFWRWRRDATSATSPHREASRDEGLALREALPTEARGLHDWWLRSSAYASHGLVHGDWRLGSTTPHEWEDAARRGGLLVAAGYSQAEARLAPALAMIEARGSEPEGDRRSIAALGGMPGDMARLLQALADFALARGINELFGFFPDSVEVYRALESAGFAPDPDDERYCVFELVLEPPVS